MGQEEKLNSRAIKDLLPEVLYDGIDPAAAAADRGLLQSNTAESLQPIVDEVIGENPTVVQEFLAGKEASVQFLVGQGMKKSRGAANPKLLRELLETTMQSEG